MARARGEVREIGSRCGLCHGDDPAARIRHQLMDFGTVDEAAIHVGAQFPQATYLDEFRVWWQRERTRRFGTGRTDDERRQTGLEGVASIIERVKPKVTP